MIGGDNINKGPQKRYLPIRPEAVTKWQLISNFERFIKCLNSGNGFQIKLVRKLEMGYLAMCPYKVMYVVQ